MVKHIIYRKIVSREQSRCWEGLLEIDTDLMKLDLPDNSPINIPAVALSHGKGGDINVANVSRMIFTDDPLKHTIHYATAVFEGIRAKYDSSIDRLFGIQFKEHTQRFIRSMEAMALVCPQQLSIEVPEEVSRRVAKPQYVASDAHFMELTPEEVERSIVYLIKENTKIGLIKPRDGKIYIRPIAYRGDHPEGRLGVYSLGHDIVLDIIVQEWGEYMTNPNFAVYPQGVDDPIRQNKCSGNYCLGSRVKNWAMYGLNTGRALNFGDGILTDCKPERNIQEATGANIFVYTSKEILTPKIKCETDNTGQYILPGTKRALAIEIAQNLGIRVSERDIPLAELLKSAEAVFFTGTATGVKGAELVYDPLTGRYRTFNVEGYTPLTLLQREFNSVLGGGDLEARANEAVRNRIRTPI